jgi:lipid-A-disaccharide synthase-like uncharacterized protein
MSILHEPIAQLGKLTVNGWKIIGWTGALMFTGRWIVQLIASKRHKRPTFPVIYWWMSVVGALMTLSYFIWGKNDSVGILQNLFPAFVASYNLYLELTHRRRQESRSA